jgi:hypothetical protein
MPMRQPLAARVYHMTEAVNWPMIEREGLLSTSRLLDLAGVGGAERVALERRQRVRSATLLNGAVIRDQTPMPPAALARCLRGGLTPEDWYAELNRRVFFWFDTERLNRQRRACGASAQIVVVIDAPAMLARHGGRATLTAFNTGNAAVRRSCPTRIGSSRDGRRRRRRSGFVRGRAVTRRLKPRSSTRSPTSRISSSIFTGLRPANFSIGGARAPARRTIRSTTPIENCIRRAIR